MPLCQNCRIEIPHGDLRFATCPVCGRIAEADERTEEFDAVAAVAAAPAHSAQAGTATAAGAATPRSSGVPRSQPGSQALPGNGDVPGQGDATEEFDAASAAAASASRSANAGAAPSRSQALPGHGIPRPSRGTRGPDHPSDADWGASGASLTFDCDELPPDISRSMNAVWLPAIDEHTAPNVTVKGPEPQADLGRTLDALVGEAQDLSLPGGDFTIADGAFPGDHTRGTRASSDDPGTVHSPSDETITDLVIKQRNFCSAADESASSPDAEYELINILGEGGMGVVYAARQRSVNRSVAVKMLKRRGIGRTEQEIARQKFLAEAVVTGDLDHPNIVPIYDVGRNEHDALFYSMKRVHGTPWLEVLAAKSLNENLEILMKVADAVAFAHSRGVVHRDLKPENVMLGEFGEVQLMDWGLALPTARFDKAKRLAKTRGMGGTPAYMAPEMATGPLARIGPHSDIYLLGAILFEIITGRRPHEGENARDCLIAAARNQIVRTRKSGELMDIALKAMSTRPKDRYATVQEFQAAIRDYLSHAESIALSTQAEQDLRKAAKSDDYQDFSQALFGFKEALKLWDGNSKAEQGQDIARLGYAESAYHKGDYELGLGLLDLSVPEHAALYGEIQAAMAERDARQQRLNTARRLGRCLVGVVFAVVTCAAVWINAERKQAVSAKVEAERQTEIANEKKQEAEAFARQEREQRQKAVEAEKAATAARLATEAARQAEAYEGYIARIGLAAAKIRENAFGTALDLLRQCQPHKPGEPDLRHWEWGRLMHLCSQTVRSTRVDRPLHALAVSPDGLRFVAAGEGGVARIHDRETQVAVAELRLDGHDVYAVAYSPDGRFIATGSGDPNGYVRLWDAANGQPVRTYRTGGGFATEHTAPVLSVAFSHDGRLLLTGSQDETARLWNVATGDPLRRLWGHSGWVWSAAFCPNPLAGRTGSPSYGRETRIVTASQDGTARIWIDGTPPQQPPWTRVDGDATFREHDGPVFAAAFSPDGKLVATGGYDRRVLVWDPDRIMPDQIRERVTGAPVQETRHRTLDGHTAAVRTLAFLGDSRHIVSGSDDNTVKLWNVATGSTFKTFRKDRGNTFRGHDSSVRGVAFPGAPGTDGVRWILSAGLDGTVKEWSIADYEEIRELEGRVLAGRDGHAAAILSAEFSADGKTILTASQDRTAKTWDAERGWLLRTFREGHELLASSVVFFRDGRRIVTAAVDNTARVWDVATGTELLRLDHTGRSAALAVSRDQKWILTGSDRAAGESLWKAKLWDAATGRLVRELAGHRHDVTAVAFSADARLAATGDAAGRVCLWETLTGKRLREIDGHSRGGHITGIAFTPDARRVLTASTDQTVATWDVATGDEMAARRMRHPEPVVSMALTPDGKQVLTSCEDRVVRLWDAESAQVIRLLDTGAGLVNAVDIAADGRRALTVNVMSLDEGSESAASRPGTNDLTLRLWDLATGEEITYPRSAPGSAEGPFLDFKDPMLAGLVWSASFSPDGEHIVTVGGSTARMWTTRRGAPGDLAVRPQRSRSQASLGTSLGIASLSPRDREIMRFSPQAELAGASFSTDGEWIVTASWDGTTRLWDRRSGRALVKLTGPAGHRGRINSAVFAPGDGRQVLTAGDDGTVRLWRIEAGDSGVLVANVVRTFRPEGDSLARVHQAVFSPDGAWVLAAADDGWVRVWTAGDARPVVAFQAHEQAPVLCAAFSADGRRILTGSEDGTARIWDLTQLEGSWAARHVLTFKGHTARITSVAFSPVEDVNGNGRPDPGEPHGLRALTASGDTTVKLWDTRLSGTRFGKEILTLSGHNQEVTSVRFSPDGRRVLTAARDGRAIVWLTVDWRQKQH